MPYLAAATRGSVRTPRRSIGYVQPFDYQVAKRPEASKQRGKSAETVPLGCVGVLTSCSIVGICHLGIVKSLTYIYIYIISVLVPNTKE